MKRFILAIGFSLFAAGCIATPYASGSMVGWSVICLFIVGGISGFFTMAVAKAKGYDENKWFAFGFFFSLFALIAIAGMPMKDREVKK